LGPVAAFPAAAVSSSEDSTRYSCNRHVAGLLEGFLKLLHVVFLVVVAVVFYFLEFAILI
jgi:hypothetical protein